MNEIATAFLGILVGILVGVLVVTVGLLIFMDTPNPFGWVRRRIKAPPQQRYCTECGSLLLPKETTAKFDAVTGEPWREVWLECPKYEADQAELMGSWGAKGIFAYGDPPSSKHDQLHHQRRKVKGMPSDG